MELLLNDLYEQSRHHRAGLLETLPEEQTGTAYQKWVANFVNEIDRQSKAVLLPAQSYASLLAETAGRSWRKQREILCTYMMLAKIAEQFGHHPTKPVGAVLVSAQNEILALGANRIPEPLPPHGRYLEKGTRRDQVLCAERVALANALGLSLKEPDKCLSPAEYDAALREVVSTTHQRLVSETRWIRPIPAGSTIIATSSPCLSCAEALVKQGIAHVVADTSRTHKFKRQDSMLRGRELMEKNGISFTDVSLG